MKADCSGRDAHQVIDTDLLNDCCVVLVESAQVDGLPDPAQARRDGLRHPPFQISQGHKAGAGVAPPRDVCQRVGRAASTCCVASIKPTTDCAFPEGDAPEVRLWHLSAVRVIGKLLHY